MQQKVFILSLFFLSIHVPFNGLCQDSMKTADQNRPKSHLEPGKHSLHGTIKAKGTGEVIIGATISVTGSQVGTVSNEYGFYSLTLPQNDYTIGISAIGMKLQQV